MKHDESRKRVCVCCMCKIGRLQSRVIHLEKNKNYLEKISKIFPDYDVEHFWNSTVLCDACATIVRKTSWDQGQKSLPIKFSSGASYILAHKRRGTRENFKLEHRDCKLCSLATASPLKTTFATKPKQRKKSDAAHSKALPATVHVSHKDLRRIQVKNGLSQNQILSVLRDLRFATNDKWRSYNRSWLQTIFGIAEQASGGPI